MLTKAQIKYIQSLSRQKYRKEYNAYLVEGDKNAKEWLQSNAIVKNIACLESWANEFAHLIQQHPEAQVSIVPEFELEKMTALQHAQQVILVVEKPKVKKPEELEADWTLLLDKIQDPGNMGTIIRTADWFGIKQIICTPDCVEIFNPKVVQASMGSLLRVAVIEQDVSHFLATNKLPLYASSLDGANINQLNSTKKGVIAMGNESQGLSKQLQDAAHYLVKIWGSGSAESLNVAVATGIICSRLVGN